MKKNKMMKGLLVAVLAASLVIGMASCGGGNDPKSLAKQTYELQEEISDLDASDASDLAKLTPLMEKAKSLEEKTKQLSEADQKIYLEEFARLSEE